MKSKKIIGITGVCCSGKTLLAERLSSMGYQAKEIAQEHSRVPDLWEQVWVDFLVVLDCSYETIKRRRDIAWPKGRLAHQRRGLRKAKSNCDIYLNTDNLLPEQVLAEVLAAYQKKFGFKNGQKKSSAKAP